MKHVGLNVAADPFMTLALHRRQRRPGARARPTTPACTPRRTSRTTALTPRFAKVPMLEPSDSQEAYDFVAEAFELSRGVRHAGDAAHDDAALARARPGRCRASRVAARSARLRARHRQVRDGARSTRASGNRLALAAPRAPARARRGRRRSTSSRRAPPTSASSPRASPTSTPARPSRRRRSSSWACPHPLPYEKVAQALQSVSRVARGRGARPVHRGAGAGPRPAGRRQGGDPRPTASSTRRRCSARSSRSLKRRPPRRRRPVFPPRAVIAPRPQPTDDLPVRPPVLCPGCSHRAVYAMLRRQQGRRHWATSAATRSAPCRRCSRSTAASAWAPASA